MKMISRAHNNMNVLNGVKRQNEVMEEFVIPQIDSNKSISVVFDDSRSIVIMRIYGELEEPVKYARELDALRDFSSRTTTIEITVNSPGGDVSTFLPIYNYLKLYRNIITIGMGDVSSAAFMIWACGDIRVASDYCIFMAHRESYGMYGKTMEHLSMSAVFNKVYEELFEDLYEDILTEEEKQISLRSECYISYADLIERGAAISYDDYLFPPKSIVRQHIYTIDDNEQWVFDEELDIFVEYSVLPTGRVVHSLEAYAKNVEIPSSLEEEDQGKEITIPISDVIEEDTSPTTSKRKNTKKGSDV